MKNLPNLLIISGNGRDSGKTSLACEIIKKFSSRSIIAIKICPHFYPEDGGLNVVFKDTNFTIAEEKNTTSGKDSSRMLEAGADKVYFIQVKDDQLENAFAKLMTLINPKSLLICESGWLRSMVKPGVFIMANHEGREDLKENFKKLMSKADLKVIYNGQSFHPGIEKIRLRNQMWGIL